MSYILDALRRADAERERERGGVPDLNAQPSPELGAGPAARPGRRSRLPWILGALVLALLLPLVGWLLADPGPTPGVGAAAPAAAPARPADPPAPPAARETAPPADDDAAGLGGDAAADLADDPLEPQAPLAATPRPAPGAAPRPAARPAEAATAAPSPPALPAAPATASPAAAPTGGPRVHALNELPPAIRAEVPQFNFGGSMYSEDPRSRMLIVEGQVLREGDAIGPQMRLVQIRPKSAVFDYKGYRYEVPL